MALADTPLHPDGDAPRQERAGLGIGLAKRGYGVQLHRGHPRPAQPGNCRGLRDCRGAIPHDQRLDGLRGLPDGPERRQLELGLQMLRGLALRSVTGGGHLLEQPGGVAEDGTADHQQEDVAVVGLAEIGPHGDVGERDGQ